MYDDSVTINYYHTILGPTSLTMSRADWLWAFAYWRRNQSMSEEKIVAFEKCFNRALDDYDRQFEEQEDGWD